MHIEKPIELSDYNGSGLIGGQRSGRVKQMRVVVSARRHATIYH